MKKSLGELMKDYEEYFVLSINGNDLELEMIEYLSYDRISVRLSNVEEGCYSIVKDSKGDTDLVIHNMETFMKATVDEYEKG